MNNAGKLVLAVLVGIPLIGFAQNRSRLEDEQSSSSCINHIVFSQEFLARYPRAGAACREVKVENGHKWARFDANIVRVKGNRVTADFVDRYERSVGSVTFDASRDARVDVNGRSMSFTSLRPGDKLSVWMPDDRVGFYAQPGASETRKLAVVDTAPAKR